MARSACGIFKGAGAQDVSLDETLENYDNKVTHADFIESKDGNVEDYYCKQEIIELVEETVESFKDKRSKGIIYSLLCGNRQVDTARAYSCTQSNVNRVNHSFKKNLAKRLQQHGYQVSNYFLKK